MADLFGAEGFDATAVDPAKAFEALPQAKYLATIVNSDRKPTKAGTGERVEFEYEVLEPAEYKGRKVFSGHNLANPNPKAVEIAKRELSAICHAVGVMRPKDSLELHGLPLVIDVRVEKRADTGGLKNEIKGWEPKGTPLTKPQPLPAAGAPGPGAAPWAKQPAVVTTGAKPPF